MTHSAILVDRYGGPDALHLSAVPTRRPGPDEVTVQVIAVGIGSTDIVARRGEYILERHTPLTPGYELCGTIVDHGDRVPSNLKVGTIVAACLPRMGGYTESVTMPAYLAVPVPAEVDPVAAAAIPLDFLTALSMIERHGRLKSGDALFIQGVSGGLGRAVATLGRNRGLRMAGTCSPGHRGAVEAMGVVPLDYRNPDIVGDVKEVFPEGVHAAFDHRGGRALRDAAAMLRRGGVVVSAAFAARPGHIRMDTIRGFAANALLGLTPGIRTAVVSIPKEIDRHRQWYQTSLASILDSVRDGTVTPMIGQTFPLAQAASAHRTFESGTVTGKLILTTGHPQS